MVKAKMTTIASQDEPASFEQDATSVLSRMRNAVAAVVGAVSGEIGTAAELERTLKLDKRLSWRIFRIARATEPLSVGGYVPGRASIKKFMNAAARHGASPTMIESVEAVYRDFEQLVKAHAGDRSSFDSLVSAFDRDAAQQMDLQQRRAAFRAGSHILGIQARTQLSCSILHPSANPEMDDLISIRGIVGLLQTRRHRRWVVSRSQLRSNDEAQVYADSARQPLDSNAESEHGVELLSEFCSIPLPQIRTFTTKDRHVKTELVLEAVGKGSAITCMLGSIWRETIEHYRDADNPDNGAIVCVRTPVETLIHDLVVFKGMYGRINPEVIVISDHDGTGSEYEGDGDLLETDLSVTYLGQGPSVLQTLDVPRYPEMVQYAFDQTGWDGEKFDVYRCRMEYPVMPSSVVVRFDLPEKP